jgi:hypothetical protein
MRKIIFILLLTSALTKSLACNCKSISKYDDFVASDLVFLGEAIEVSELFFKIKIYEFFKEQSSDTLVANIDDCSIIPEKDEIWLFYANKTGNGKIYISQCSSSRSFKRPFSFSMDNFPKPPPPNIDEGLLKIMDELNKDRGLIELYYDIENLRVKKIQVDLQKSNENLLRVKEQMRLLVVGLSFCILLTGILGVIIYMRTGRNPTERR